MSLVPRKLRLREVLFLVSMWLRSALRCLNRPDAVREKRLAAPLCVFIFGMLFVKPEKYEAGETQWKLTIVHQKQRQCKYLRQAKLAIGLAW